MQEITEEGVSGNWLIPTARAKAIPAAATVIRHHFFDEKIKQHLCASCLLDCKCRHAGPHPSELTALSPPIHIPQGPPTSGARRRSW